MPNYATISGDLYCYRCHVVTGNQIDVQWGKLPNRYNVGDVIQWLTIDGKILDSFTLHEGLQAWNCGNSSILDLIALDCWCYDTGNPPGRVCRSCHAPFYGASASIMGGIIVSIQTHNESEINEMLGDYIGKADIITIQQDQLQIRDEWFDPPIQYIPTNR